MTEESISLYDLLNVSIEAPRKGVVNFGALHELLHAVLSHLGIRDMRIQWREAVSCQRRPEPPEVVSQDSADRPNLTQGDTSTVDPGNLLAAALLERTASPPSPQPASGTAAADKWRLQSRVQTCEDGVSRAMKLIQEIHSKRDGLKEVMEEIHSQRDDLKEVMEEIHSQRDGLKEQMEEIHSQRDDLKEQMEEIHSQRDGLKEQMEEIHSQRDDLKEVMEEIHSQQKMVGAQADSVVAMEKCCLRLDALEETVTSLRDIAQKYPDPEELSPSGDVMQSALLSERDTLQEDLVSLGVVVFKPPNSPSKNKVPNNSPTRSSSSSQPVEPTTSGEIASGPDGDPETVEALKNMGRLKERQTSLEARVAELEEGEEIQGQLEHIRELLSNKASQDVCNNLTDRLKQQRASTDSLMSDREKNGALMDSMQQSILQLQAECVKLQDDIGQKQSDIENLYKTTEQLEEKKADKQMVETEIKADKCALDSKVSRLQFDSVTEQLNAMFHELLSKLTGQEQDWHKVVAKLSTEMECKLNRLELDSVKKQLEDRWKNIHEKLQAQGAPEHEDAAGLRKQLVDRFHCLSCDRPVAKHTPGPHVMTLPSTPGFPSHKSIRPFTVYALEQFRHHYRSERSSEADYSHPAVSRSCGGTHTVTSTSQRRSGLPYMKPLPQSDVDPVVQSEEVDIVGLDGHIYKGRLNAASIRNTDTKLPTIATRDGTCKTRDKARSSPTHKPAASIEAGHGAPVHLPHSARSAQCSRSATSSPGRDWPVSVLGCTSQSSVVPASSAAESSSEPQDKQLLDL